MFDPNMLAMACPSCGKRAFDTTDLPDARVTIKMKCPHCGILVVIPLEADSLLRKLSGAANRTKSLKRTTVRHGLRRKSHD
jgi:endogenous inhibitor of DNA gyrase (YacG/DUF329 family)